MHVGSLIGRMLGRLAYSCPGGYSLRPALHRWRGAKIGRNVWISQHVYLDEIHPEAISIGDNASIGLGTSIIAHFYWGPRKSVGGFSAVTIARDVFVGPHCAVLPGVHIGEGAVIKAGSVVSRSVPAHMMWGPPPCGPLAHVDVPLTPEHGYEAFTKGLRPLAAARSGVPAAIPDAVGRDH